jgi:hypothetical protein
MGEVTEILKVQCRLFLLDEKRAIHATPKLLPKSLEQRQAALNTLKRIFAARDTLPPEGKGRLARIQAFSDVKAGKPAKGEAVNA